MMRLRRTALACCLLLSTAGGCSQQSLLSLPAGNPPALETGTTPGQPAGHTPSVANFVAPGEPTEIYSEIARGALGCWLGADGPLKRSHIFQAEAAPAATGGNAEIALHERDAAVPDQKGARAFKVSLTQTAGGTRVIVEALKMQPDFAQAMVQDVQTWAARGQGCRLRAVAPPPPAPVAAPKVAKGKAAR